MATGQPAGGRSTRGAGASASGPAAWSAHSGVGVHCSRAPPRHVSQSAVLRGGRRGAASPVCGPAALIRAAATAACWYLGGAGFRKACRVKNAQALEAPFLRGGPRPRSLHLWLARLPACGHPRVEEGGPRAAALRIRHAAPSSRQRGRGPRRCSGRLPWAASPTRGGGGGHSGRDSGLSGWDVCRRRRPRCSGMFESLVRRPRRRKPGFGAGAS